jgi:hypothetical protein
MGPILGVLRTLKINLIFILLTDFPHTEREVGLANKKFVICECVDITDQ